MEFPTFSTQKKIELNLANSFNLKKIIREANSFKLVLTFNYEDFKRSRGKNWEELVEHLSILLDGRKKLIKNIKCFKIYVIKVPTIESFINLKKWVLA